MKTKKLLFIFIMLFINLSNLKAQQEILFYSFHHGKVYFYLELKKRAINNRHDLYEYSWGPSIPKWTKYKDTHSPKNSNTHYFYMCKTKYRKIKNKYKAWVPISELEKFIFGSRYSEESQNKNGYSTIKLDSLPKIKNCHQTRNLRQKIVYYELINAITNSYQFFKKKFSDLKKESVEEYERMKKEKEEEEEEMDILLQEIANVCKIGACENQFN